MAATKSPAEVYEEYFVPGNFGRWAPLLVERAAPGRGERALDVACGTGIVARIVAPVVGEEGSVTGLDRSPEMLAIARSLSPPVGASIDWVEGDSTDLPDGPFDLVLCQQGLQFFPDRLAAVAEMRRVVPDDGGRVVVSVWQDLDRQSVYAALGEAEAAQLGVSVEEVMGAPFSMGDAGELGRLFEDAGFGDVEVSPASRIVRFPDPERFVQLTILAAAAVLPVYDDLDEAAQLELVEVVTRELHDVIVAHTDGDAVAFPMHANIVLARP